MDICICSLSNRPWLYELTQPILQNYCNIHNYNYIFRNRIIDINRHPAWSKLLLIKEILPKYDYVVWIDDDIVITDMDTKISKFIVSHKCVTVQADPKLTDFTDIRKDDINCGFIIFKNNINTIKFIDDWYNYCDDVSNYEPNWEQDILIKYHNDVDNTKIHILPYRTFQSFHRNNGLDYEWKEGDFSAHLTGIEKNERLQIFDILKNNYINKKYLSII